jgi:membrane protein YqaA with SNARE-associated domain
MMEALQGDFGLYGGAIVICFLAGLIPIINTEIYLITASTVLVTSPMQLPLIVLLGATSQMVAKVLLYFTAAGALKLPTGRYQAKIDKARERIERWRDKPKWILFVSALLGLPPFYVVSLLAGALGIRLPTFCAIGLLGRVLRFGIIVALPWL